MPEFEEPDVKPNSPQNYIPSTDAKPRTRRRSGGFKTEPPKMDFNIGEVDPVKALKEEKLSGPAKSADQVPSERPARPERGERRERTDRPERSERPRRAERAERSERPERPERRATHAEPVGNAAPSEATLAAISRVEARIEERRQARGANRPEREKTPKRQESPRAPRGNAPKKPAKKKGLLATILGFFGLGAKEPARKNGAAKGTNRDGDERPARPRTGERGNRSGGDRPRRPNNGGDRRGKGNSSGRRRSGGGPRGGQRRDSQGDS